MIDDVPGMKTLLLDIETTPIVSLVTTQSALLTKECYLIDRIDNRQRDKMKHLKCICFIQPTRESIQYLVEELRDPAYGDYYIFFSNTLPKADLERLAEVDEHEVVREVQEYFGDYLAINSDLFSFGMSPYHLFGNDATKWDSTAFERCVRGVSSRHIQQEGQLFDFRRPDTPPILMILDRRNDPVTPLLAQWTYQAMVHELIGIHHGRVDMSNVPDIRNELKEIALSPDQDPFFKKSMYWNLGDLGANIKKYVDEYQTKTKSNMNIESIADMKRFVEEYPEFRKLSGNVSKHVALVSELSRRVAQDRLLELSELEQNLACNENHNSDLKNIRQMIEDHAISDPSKIRLVLLYALRYERMPNNAIKSLVDLLDNVGVSEKYSALVPAILYYAGYQQRQDNLFSNQTFLSRGKSVLKGLKGVENVYTQHTPVLGETLDSLIKARLKETDYPFADGTYQQPRERPQDIIIFMIGGTTFEEARYVAQLNATVPGIRIVLGGTCIHNSTSFMQQVEQIGKSYMN
ncbi:hypothetical protein [Absidia glauca]|uniref:Vacuolar protein sorting-associated protein 45 n=1 Tax=Absidia glauca TaxID=4829 RepID=A0A168KRQ3_ABSGL|nr:hypothetical protein [Absidia glauca]